MVKLSAVIITYNEEKNIGKCLDSIMQIVEDIVVVDSYSTDKTEEICKSKGVRFVQHEFQGHIEQKNWALSQAKYAYVLSLDADEVLSQDLANMIIETKTNWYYDGYYVNRLNYYCGKWIKHCGWYPDRKLRLWNKEKGKWGGTNPHDKVIMDKNTKTKQLNGDILHFSFHSIEEHVDQINKFSSIKANMAFKKGKKYNMLKLLILPSFKFLRGYILKMGFLDGFYGLVVCINSAHSEFLKYAKLKRLENGQ